MRDKIVDPLELIYLHVFVIPVELWLEQYRFAYNNAVLESKSAGFIRIAPKTSLFEIRKYIRDQLGEDNIPTDFVFLRSVGRCLAVVNQNQEMEMRAREFVPPATFSPELLLLPSSREDVLVTLPKTDTSKTSNQNLFQYNTNIPDSREYQSSESDDVPFSSLTNDGTASYETVCNKTTRSSSNESTQSQISATQDVVTESSNEGLLINRSSHENQVNLQQIVDTSTSSENEEASRENVTKGALATEQNSTTRTNSQLYKTAGHLFQDNHEHKITTDNGFVTTLGHSSSLNQIKSPNLKQSTGAPTKVNRRSAGTKKQSTHVENNHSQASKKSGNESITTSLHKNEDIQYTGDTSYNNQYLSGGETDQSQDLKENRVGSVENVANVSPNAKRIPGSSKELGGYHPESSASSISTTKTTDNDARRLALEAKMKARFEKEQKRLEEENLLKFDLTEEKGRELISQVEEMRRTNNSSIDRRPLTSGRLSSRSPASFSAASKTHSATPSATASSNVKEAGESKKKRVSDEKKLRELKNEEQDRKRNDLIQQRRLEVEHLKEKLEEIKTEKHSIQRVREVNGKRMRSLQTELNMKSSHVNNQWKKKYEEERKQTNVLEDKLKKLQGQVDFQHRKLISRSCLSKPKDVQHSKGAPSERSNQQNMVLRLQNEIEQLKMTISLTNKKLTAETKMKQFAVQELKELRTKAIESKINASRAKKTLSPPGT